MCIIKRNNEYIGEGVDGYFLTIDINKAKRFTWRNFIFGKKIVLEGIYNVFGNGFNYVKV